MAAPRTKLVNKKVTVDIATIGMIGAILLCIIDKTTKPDDWYQQPLTLGVPLVSAFFANASKWIWDVFSPEHAEIIKLRSCIKRQISATDEALKAVNISSSHKEDLLRTREKLDIELINSHQYVEPPKK